MSSSRVFGRDGRVTELPEGLSLTTPAAVAMMLSEKYGDTLQVKKDLAAVLYVSWLEELPVAQVT